MLTPADLPQLAKKPFRAAEPTSCNKDQVKEAEGSGTVKTRFGWNVDSLLKALRSRYPAGITDEEIKKVKLDLVTVKVETEGLEMLLSKSKEENAELEEIMEETNEFLELAERWAAGAGQGPQSKGGESVAEVKEAEPEV